MPLSSFFFFFNLGLHNFGSRWWHQTAHHLRTLKVLVHGAPPTPLRGGSAALLFAPIVPVHHQTKPKAHAADGRTHPQE